MMSKRVTVTRGDLEYDLTVTFSLYEDTAPEVTAARVDKYAAAEAAPLINLPLAVAAVPADVVAEAVAIAEEYIPPDEPANACEAGTCGHSHC